MKITINQLSAFIDKAVDEAKSEHGSFKEEDCIVKWYYLVEGKVSNYQFQIEDDSRDFYGAPNGETRDCYISFDIDDYETHANVVGIANGAIVVDRSWNKDTKFSTLAEFRKSLEASVDNSDAILKVSYDGAPAISQDFDVENIKVKVDLSGRGWNSDPTGKSFKAALILGTYDVMELCEQDVEDYVEANWDYMVELAYEYDKNREPTEKTSDEE